MEYTVENKHEDLFLLSQMHLDFFPVISICSWHIMLPFTACHWLLTGPKCEACGFDCITGRPSHKATAVKCSSGKESLGSKHENYITFSWSMSSCLVLDWIGHFIFGIPVDFMMMSVQHSLNKDIQGCKEKWKLGTQMHCKEALLGAAVTVF